MEELIQLTAFPVKDMLPKLLLDKTTGKNIIFATDTYRFYGLGYSDDDQITVDVLRGFGAADIQPRVRKAQQEQSERTRKKAEVFTPTWIVRKMNDECQKDWESIADWKKIITRRVLEITCGEAPFLATRYDTTTGEPLEISKRTGILDRKLRLISQNAADEKEWLSLTVKAFESTYGYEYQGDNLLIARINLLVTFCDYMSQRWGRQPTKSELFKITNIICWNIWQMDGLKDVVPNGMPGERSEQLSLFDDENTDDPKRELPCRIYDWRSKRSLQFKDIKEGKIKMKFDYVIGNPPYQEETEGTSDKPVYNYFMDASYAVADKVELITPARFLFKAGKTPKAWNEKMLSDEHLKILYYEQISSNVFCNTDIKGGICVSYHDRNKKFGAIEVFSHFNELRTINAKVQRNLHEGNLSDIMFLQNRFNLNVLYQDYPEFKDIISSSGRERRIVSSSFEKLSVFHKDAENDDDVKILGIANSNKRLYKYIRKIYIEDNGNFEKYKILVPKSNGSGAIGEVLSTPLCGTPLCGYTQSFIGIGAFDTEREANNCLKYIKSKFARTMLGILKITQDNPPEKWRLVPLQNFTENSDINWNVSVAEIDKQLYKKYGLSDEEIEFIESHVKEMV